MKKAGILLLIALICVMLLSCSGKVQDVNLKDYVSLKLDGYNGKATAEAVLDYAKLKEDTGMENSEDRVQVSLSKASMIKNGDVLKVQWKVNTEEMPKEKWHVIYEDYDVTVGEDTAPLPEEYSVLKDVDEWRKVFLFSSGRDLPNAIAKYSLKKIICSYDRSYSRCEYETEDGRKLYLRLSNTDQQILTENHIYLPLKDLGEYEDEMDFMHYGATYTYRGYEQSNGEYPYLFLQCKSNSEDGNFFVSFECEDGISFEEAIKAVRIIRGVLKEDPKEDDWVRALKEEHLTELPQDAKAQVYLIYPRADDVWLNKTEHTRINEYSVNAVTLTNDGFFYIGSADGFDRTFIGKYEAVSGNLYRFYGEEGLWGSDGDRTPEKDVQFDPSDTRGYFELQENGAMRMLDQNRKPYYQEEEKNILYLIGTEDRYQK